MSIAPAVSVPLGDRFARDLPELALTWQAEHAWLSPLPPEGASAILHHDTAHAPLMAERQKISAFDLLDEGTVHVVVPERPAAHEDPRAFVRAMTAACVAAIGDAIRRGGDRRARSLEV